MSEEKKSGCFGKLLKLVLWGFVGIVALVLLLVATIPLWISPVVTAVAPKVVPEFTGTAFQIERFYVNPWTGAVRINAVRLANPEGFGQTPAVSVTSVSVDLALKDLFSNVLHIKDVTIVDPFASYYSHDGVNNIDFILENVNKMLGPKEEKEEKPSEMKVIIDHLKVSGTKVKLMESDMIPPLPIMTIELNDIGKESGGATFEDAWKAITDAFMKGMSSVGDGLGAFGGLLGDGAKSLTSALGEGASGIGEGAKSAAAATADATKSVASGAVDMTKSAASAVGDGAKTTVDAIGDGAKAATDGVKNLFKGFGK